ncbi:MAG: PEP-CTERM sorting domain-containing protein [Gemmataceae bacterium]|nr:PEP-CTERM sorting domain-containing protein [Gemmataceae bacterium]
MAFAALAIGLATSGSRPAKAGIVKVVGKGGMITPTANGKYMPNAFQDSPGVVRGWDEKQGTLLKNDLYVDINKSGLFDANTDLLGFQQGNLKGKKVNSQYLYFDPKKSDPSGLVTFYFDGNILGVIAESDRFYKASTKTVPYNYTDYFLASDFLADPSSGPTPITQAGNTVNGVSIDPRGHFNNRGLEFGSPTDSVIVNVGSNFITVNLKASNPGDQIRVLTAVPEPATMAIGGLGVACMGGLLRRFRKKPDQPASA